MCVGIAACAAPAPAPARTSQPPPPTLGPTPPPAASAAPRAGGALVEAALGSLAKTLHPYQGLGVPQYSFVQPTNTRWVNPAVDTYDFALDKARQLLHDAGYQLTNGRLIGKDGQPVKVQVVYPTSSAPRARIAASLQRHYAQLGIGVDIKGLDFHAYTDQVLSRHDFDISLATYGGGSIDPELGARAQLMTSGPQNVTGYTNPRVDELFRQAASEPDATRRKQLYDQVQLLVNADVPSHYLYALTSVDVFASSVHGVATHQADRLDANSALLSWSVDP